MKHRYRFIIEVDIQPIAIIEETKRPITMGQIEAIARAQLFDEIVRLCPTVETLNIVTESAPDRE